MSPIRLKTLLGDYPITTALKSGAVRSPLVTLDFADVKVPNMAFKRVVRDLEFDVAELAIMTFLMAKEQGVPLTLLPAVLVARFQHPFIVYNSERGSLSPNNLKGRRVGIRSYTVTTATWIRSILADDYGVDPGSIEWVTFEDAHVAGVADPLNARRAAPGQDLQSMLLAGEIDAAVLGNTIADPRFKPLIPDPETAARRWREKHDGAIQINHMVAVRTSLCRSAPAVIHEAYRLLEASKRAAGLPGPPDDLNPFGLDASRHSLEIAIDTALRQGLIRRKLAVEELSEALPPAA